MELQFMADGTECFAALRLVADGRGRAGRQQHVLTWKPAELTYHWPNGPEDGFSSRIHAPCRQQIQAA